MKFYKLDRSYYAGSDLEEILRVHLELRGSPPREISEVSPDYLVPGPIVNFRTYRVPVKEVLKVLRGRGLSGTVIRLAYPT